MVEFSVRNALAQASGAVFKFRKLYKIKRASYEARRLDSAADFLRVAELQITIRQSDSWMSRQSNSGTLSVLGAGATPHTRAMPLLKRTSAVAATDCLPRALAKLALGAAAPRLQPGKVRRQPFSAAFRVYWPLTIDRRTTRYASSDKLLSSSQIWQAR